MKHPIILLSLLSLAIPLATGCGGNDETLTGSFADETAEVDSLGSNEQALRVDPSAISSASLATADRSDTITLPAVSNFDLPGGLRGHLEQTGKADFTLRLEGGDLGGGGVDPGGGAVAAKSFWEDLLGELLDKLLTKSPSVQCTTKTETTTTAEGTTTTTVTTTCTKA